MASAKKGLTPECMAQARGFYEHALALDPGNIEALVGTAFVDCVSFSIFLTDDRTARAAAAEAALTRVLSLAPNHAWAHYLLGFVHIFTNRAAEAIAKSPFRNPARQSGGSLRDGRKARRMGATAPPMEAKITRHPLGQGFRNGL
jgi:hypothetical protein